MARRPRLATSSLVSAQTLGPAEAVNAWIDAAGPGGAGDDLWATQRGPCLDAAAWGLLRVSPAAPT